MNAQARIQQAARLFAREIGQPVRECPCARCGNTTYQRYDDHHECDNCGLPFGEDDELD